MNRPDFVCGVDGGGTKTTAICCSLDGKEIARRVFGPFNLNSIGMQSFEDTSEIDLGQLNDNVVQIFNTQYPMLLGTAMQMHTWRWT